MAEGGGIGLWLRERLELARAMKEEHSSLLKDDQVDVVPPLELVGIYHAHVAVSKMVHTGKISESAGAFLIAALTCHAFCVTHHCTHESVSRSLPEHAGFENTVFRLANVLLFFDDGYKEAHRKHHQRTNEESDPDLILSHTSLRGLGSVLAAVGQENKYVSAGIPVSVNQVEFATYWNLDWLLNNEFLQDKVMGCINWDLQVTRMATNEALDTLKSSGNPEFRAAAKTLRSTWKEGSHVGLMTLALFFARYPHRNGIELANEMDSFYDNTYKAQGEVDLWMMGEGAHHCHHAKPNVSYAYLPKVCNQAEETNPELRRKARSTKGVRELEHVHELPPKTSGPSSERPWARTESTLAAAELLVHDPATAVEQLALNAIENAIRCTIEADKGLLREIYKGLDISSRRTYDHPLAEWDKTMLDESTAEEIAAHASSITSAVKEMGRASGEKLSRPLGTLEDLKSNYIDFFVALIDTCVSSSQQLAFAKEFQAHVANKWGRKINDPRKPFNRAEMLERLSQHLASPVPDNFARNETLKRTRKSSARKQVDRIFLGSNL